MAEEGSQSIPLPQKEIKNPMLMKAWTESPAYGLVTGFLEALNESVKGKSLTEGREEDASSIVSGLEALIRHLSEAVELYPPQTQPQRFGNKAFRDWHAHLVANSQSLLTAHVLTEEKKSYAPHLAAYLNGSFGDATRIDFGTGHETSFLFFLAALKRLDLLSESHFPALVNRVFLAYLKLVYKLVQTYVMEPAGSHGSWSLDDFHFLPFLWGSSQLRGHPSLEPQHFPDPAIADRNAQDYLFFTAIQHINETKSGPFAEHSAQLWNISGVHAWPKVNQGLIKMYKAEVLGKFPVAQHFLFGRLLPFRS